MKSWKRVILWFAIVALVFSFAVCQKKTQEEKTSKAPEATELSAVAEKSKPAEESKPVEESKPAEEAVADEEKKPVEKPVEEKPAEEKPAAVVEAPSEESSEPITRDNAAAILELAKGGKIVIKFYPEDAPNTVDNFIALASKGFYDGLNFHRVIKGFMAQGGQSKGRPPKSIKAEFNSQKHLEGTLAMARTPDPNSATSQFYICFAPQPHLDNDYTVFGQVIDGMDVVHTIAQGDVMKSITIVNKATVEK